MGWIDIIAVTIIIITGLIIFYKALKEPLDLLFGGSKRGIGAIRDAIANREGDSGYETITYEGGFI